MKVAPLQLYTLSRSAKIAKIDRQNIDMLKICREEKLPPTVIIRPTSHLTVVMLSETNF